MVGFIIKKFVPNSENTTDSHVRHGYGFICSVCGIVINLILFGGKLAAGAVSGAVSITADAFNNLSDAGSSIVTLIGFRLASQAPDKTHPYGHGRIEYIAGMLVSGVIFLMGLELFKSGFGKILRPSPTNTSLWAILILIASLLAKFYMYSYNKKFGRKISSPAMEAVALDSISDCFATGAVLLCALINMKTKISLDGWAAVLVSVFIMITGIKSFSETISPLLGRAPEKDFTDSIEKIALNSPYVNGIHDLAVHDYGPGRVMVSLHAEVDAEGSIFEIHEGIDEIEREISEKMHCEAVIHMDPISDDNQQTVTMKGEVRRLIEENIDNEITIHDFRIVPGNSRTTVLFDSAVPPRLSAHSEELKKKIETLVEDNFSNCRCAVKIDIQL